MAIIKSFTDLSQSKTLSKLLPLESADAWWTPLNWQETECYVEVKQDGINKPKKAIPCWSLTALLDIIPKHIREYNVLRIDINENDTAIWYDEIGCGVNNELPDITKEFSVDACVEMVIKLHELNLL